MEEVKTKKRKKTLGQKIIKAFNPADQGNECRNVVQEYIKTAFGPEFEKIIAENKNFAPKYFVWIVKQDLAYFDTKKINFVIRKSEPTPQWETMLFSYDNSSDQLFLHWALPTIDLANMIFHKPDTEHIFLVDSIKKCFPDWKPPYHLL